MPFRRSVTDDAEELEEAEVLDDAGGHMAFRRSVTQDDEKDADDDDAEGHARRY